MVDFEETRSSIRQNIKKNGKKEITGNLLQLNLLEIVDDADLAYQESIASDGVLSERIGQSEKSIEATKKDVENVMEYDAVQDTRILTLEGKAIEMEGMLGEPDGIATLDSNGHLTPSQMPDSVKRLIEGSLTNDRVFTDADGNVWTERTPGIESCEFVDINFNKTYLWSGSQFTIVGTDLALGETAETAYAGDKGKQNAEDIVTIKKDIVNHGQSIQENTSKITDLEGELSTLKSTTEEHTKQIKESQIKALIVEIRNTGFGLEASNTSDEIRNYGISGGDVFADYNDKRYKYDAFRNGQAYFRIVSVIPSKAIEERLIIYNRTVKFERDEYEVVFDATELFKAMQSQTPISRDFYLGLQEAIGGKRLMRIRDVNGELVTDLVVTCIKKGGDKLVFSAFDGRTAYLLDLNPKTLAVSLDTERIGAEFEIFNNASEKSIFGIQQGASNLDIREVFTNVRGDEVIPETGDVFNEINGEQEIVRSGLVFSRVEDGSKLHLYIQSNDIVSNYIGIYHLEFDYNPSKGMDSLRLTARDETIIDTALLDHMKLYELYEGVKRKETEANCFNISAISSSPYQSVEEALGALNAYLFDRPKNIGMEMIYVDSESNAKKYIFAKRGAGGFTNASNWKQIMF